jgi:hypothetical protein
MGLGTPYMDSLTQTRINAVAVGNAVSVSYRCSGNPGDILKGLASPAAKYFLQLAAMAWQPTKGDAFDNGVATKGGTEEAPSVDTTASPFAAVKAMAAPVRAETTRRFTVLTSGTFTPMDLTKAAVDALAKDGYTAWKGSSVTLLCIEADAFVPKNGAYGVPRVLKSANPEWHPFAIRVQGKIELMNADSLYSLKSYGKAGVKCIKEPRAVSSKTEAKKVLRLLAFPKAGE